MIVTDSSNISGHANCRTLLQTQMTVTPTTT